jgi:hypothetical protein
VRAFIGAVLGFAAMLLGVLVPILIMFGLGGMIWGCRVFSGPQPKGDPATIFATVSMIVGIPIGVWGAFCFLSLPIFAYFGVRAARKRQIEPDKTVCLARSMKQTALRYAALMDKLIDQEKV